MGKGSSSRRVWGERKKTQFTAHWSGHLPEIKHCFKVLFCWFWCFISPRATSQSQGAADLPGRGALPLRDLQLFCWCSDTIRGRGLQCWLLKRVATLSTCRLSGQQGQVFNPDREGEALEQCTQGMIKHNLGSLLRHEGRQTLEL